MNGNPVSISSPKDAIELGIGMVHQHFMLIPVMTVTENIVLAQEPKHAGVLLDYDAAAKRVRELSTSFGLAVDPNARIEKITVGQQQRVEILKALYRGAEIQIIEGLKSQGKSIVFISHKLNEVLEIADRITVLRRGKRIETIPRAGATEAGLARSMVGREVLLRVDKKPAQPGEPLLQVEDLVVRDDRGLEAVRGVSLEVRAGEIVGVAGVDGNGQSELIDALTGLRHPAGGRIRVGGEDLSRATARQVLDAGMGHIPEDRHRRGLVLDFNLAENLVLHDYGKEPFSHLGWLNPRRWLRWARGILSEFDVRGGGPTTRAGSLSGGNQQKVVVAREVSRDPSVLIAAQPTRGLDVGAIEFVHKRLVEQREAGKAVLLVSLELDEILSLSDRILVLYEGRFVAEFPPDVSEEEVGIAMTGGRREAAA